jgi:hypothetical protein
MITTFGAEMTVSQEESSWALLLGFHNLCWLEGPYSGSNSLVWEQLCCTCTAA